MAKTTKSMEFAEEWVADLAELLGRLRIAKKRELLATAKLLRAGFASVQCGDNELWNEHGANLEGLNEGEAMLPLANHAGWLAGLDYIPWEKAANEFPALKNS